MLRKRLVNMFYLEEEKQENECELSIVRFNLPIDPSPTQRILIVPFGFLTRVDARRKLIEEVNFYFFFRSNKKDIKMIY